MGNLKQSDIQEIEKLFDLELNSLSRVSRIERCKMRRHLHRVVSAFAFGAPNPRAFLLIVDEKLSKLTLLFRDERGFKRRLERLLNSRMKKGF